MAWPCLRRPSRRRFVATVRDWTAHAWRLIGARQEELDTILEKQRLALENQATAAGRAYEADQAR